jgi:uncharacterized protein
MKKAIILHGTGGSPESNWFRWLESELRSHGVQVWLPTLPHARSPRLSEWRDYVIKNAPFELDLETIIIGHSSGAVLALIVTQSLENKLGAVVCVSAFKDNSLGWDANDNLFDLPFSFDAIKNNVDVLLYIHSDDDPYCPINQPKYLHQNTGGEFVLIPDQGHFNLEKSPAYKKFPQLLQILKERRML